MTEEQWRPVVGYEGLYEVSDHGRIRSLDRYVQRNGGLASGRPVRLRGAVRKLQPAVAGGYWMVGLHKNGQMDMRYVHSLVLEAFVGPRPEGLEVCHNDGDPKNARLDNLRYDTRSENQRDQIRHGTNWQLNKTHCPSGHEYNAENTRVIKSRPNARYCKACSRKSRKAA